MKKSIALAIAAIGIGLTTNVFASASGTQVNPSTINLSAVGVTEIGIHTIVPNYTPVSCVLVVAGGIDYIFDDENLTLGSDSVGHLVISLKNWETITDGISTGVAEFFVYQVSGCVVGDGIEDIEIGSDEAKIVDNSGVNNR